MATITKENPERYNTGNSFYGAMDGTFKTYQAGTNLESPRHSMNEALIFQYQLGTTEITSCSFTFYLGSRMNYGNIPTYVTFTLIKRVGDGDSRTLASKTVDLSTLTPDGGSGWDYHGDVVFSYYGTIADVSVLYVSIDVYGQNYDGNTFFIVAKDCTVNGTQASLSVQESKANPNIGDEETLTITGRLGSWCKVSVFCDSTSGYNDRLIWLSTRLDDDVIEFTCEEEWFDGTGRQGYLPVTFKIEASDGRTASIPASLHRPTMTARLSDSSVEVDIYNALSFNNPQGHACTVKAYYGQNNTRPIRTISDATSPVTIALTEDETFAAFQSYLNSVTIRVEVHGDYDLSASATYTLTRPALGMYASGRVDPETLTTYAETGSPFALHFHDRFDRALTCVMYVGTNTLRKADGGQFWDFNDDDVLVDCLKRWFDDAANVSTASMEITIRVEDTKYRRATITLEVRAGADMYPVVTVNTAPVQPETWPAALAAYYVQGYTRARFAAAVTAPTNAVITDVSLSSSQTGPLQLTYNSESERYEVVTKAPLTGDTAFTISARDQRGLVTTTPAATLSVLPYAFPGISVDSYHRCRADGTPDDSGGWCRMVISYSFSPLENLNEKDTALSTTGYSDERTLTAYSKTEIYLFEANTEHSYQILIRAVDLLNTVSRVVTLSTAGVIMDFLAGGKGIGLGKVAEIAECVEVNPEWKFKAAVIELNGTDLGTLLARIQERLTNGGL